jgi:hypothetical protein
MLPAKLPLDAYRPFRRDVEAQRPAMEAIAARHGLPPGELAPFSQGTHIRGRRHPHQCLRKDPLTLRGLEA